MSRRSVRRDVRRAVTWALALAGLYSLYVVALFALRGAAPFKAVGLSLGAVLALYAGGALAAGAIVGVLMPLARWRAGAAAVGAVAAIPFVAGVLLAVEGPFPVTAARPWAKILFVAATLGGLTGLVLWSPPGHHR